MKGICYDITPILGSLAEWRYHENKFHLIYKRIVLKYV